MQVPCAALVRAAGASDRVQVVGSTVRALAVASAPFVALWLCPLQSMPSLDRLGWLSADEHIRAGRFVFKRDRRRYLAARCAMRECLSAATGMAPGTLQIVGGAFEKPRLANVQSCYFNLSRRDDWALLGISLEGEIGVDVEVHHVVEDATMLARTHFSVEEFNSFLAVESSERDDAFLRVWTRKEACLKAVGTGLRIPPALIEVGLGAGAVELSIPLAAGPACVTVQTVNAGAGFVAAVARVL